MMQIRPNGTYIIVAITVPTTWRTIICMACQHSHNTTSRGGSRISRTVWIIGAECRTSLGWPEVFARSGRTRPRATSFLNAQSPAFVHLALQGFLCGVCFFCSNHLNEAEAARLAGVWVTHYVAFFHLAVLLKQTGNLSLRETWVDAGDEEIRAGVESILRRTIIGWWTATKLSKMLKRGFIWENLCFTGHRAHLPVRHVLWHRRHDLGRANESDREGGDNRVRLHRANVSCALFSKACPDIDYRYVKLWRDVVQSSLV